MFDTVYFDNNSTTPVDPEVLEAMLPYFTTRFGNPSNTLHSLGVDAAEAVEKSRGQVAALIGATPREVVFTSGATESNNLAILGVCQFNRQSGRHIVTACTEHRAVLEPCRHLESDGQFEVTYLPVDRFGMVSPDDVEKAITPNTVLVTIMAANNEIGTLQPIREIGQVCRDRGVLFHTDAAQAGGRISVDVDTWNVDLMSLSAHKMYGPKGVGALFIRQGGAIFGMSPLVYGGGQERGLRSGTPAVPQIVGLGAACVLARELLVGESARIDSLARVLMDQLLKEIPDAMIHGHPELRLPGLINIAFRNVDGDVFIHLLKGVAASQGSSCSAGAFETSHVLREVGIDDELARASLRLGIGRFTTEAEVSLGASRIVAAVNEARAVTEDTLVR